MKNKKTGANPDSLSSQSSSVTATAMSALFQCADGNLVKIDNVYTENISYMES